MRSSSRDVFLEGKSRRLRSALDRPQVMIVVAVILTSLVSMQLLMDYSWLFSRGLEMTVSVEQEQATVQLPAFLYILELSGFGSQMINLFSAAIYYEEKQNRSMIVDEHTYMYRSNETGVLSAYFTPQFPVIDNVQQQHRLIDPNFPDGKYSVWRAQRHLVHWKSDEQWPQTSSDKLLVTGLYSTRNEVFQAYDTKSFAFYEKMVRKTCPHLQFNDAAKRLIGEYQQRYGLKSASLSHPSVAFHVRRGDKVAIGESQKFDGQAYVQRLLRAAPDVDFQTCFVATDSYDAVSEIELALQQNNITCQLKTLTQPHEVGFDYARHYRNQDLELLPFLAQLEVLQRTTHFVGTFNSNVGSLTAVLRGCDAADDGDLTNYANSHGVDTDAWYLL